ncbi:C-type mannose receptor 2-like [Garra rufa]|uniref:C-type mannose receptor 2-like n=1 Tax=Garra rufa TaxID=137080 RepID=UPI003CCED3CF
MSEPVYGNIIRKETRDKDRRNKRQQTPQHTGSDSVKSRGSRAAVVCLVLLCVLLLTAILVLCVHIHTNNTNYTEERNELLTKITNLTEDRDELLTKNNKLSEDRGELLTKHQIINEWIYYQYSLYYMSTVKKNWTGSREDCQERGANLIIINDREEQDFVKKITVRKEFWIGVNDADKKGTWKWVDGSTLTTGFWASKEPNGKGVENCAVTCLTKHPELTGWIDVKCDDAHQWICEKIIVLCVHIHTNYTDERKETRQLQTRITNLTEERDELLTMISNLAEEREQLLNKNINLTNVRDGLLTKNNNLAKQRDQCNQEKCVMFKSLREMDGWIYQSSFYFVSLEKKNWTESRRYCLERGADLIIINNREEQEFIKKNSGGAGVWIGLTDIDVEGRWTWGDGNTLTSGFSFWGIGEPNGQRGENCVVSYPSGWYDYSCSSDFNGICENHFL